jgi:release factor glutamine methyltransferase
MAAHAIRIVRLPGVFAPRSDTWLLAEHLVRHPRVRGTVLDVCTGSGALAIAAARAMASSVTAVDVSRRALATVRINARLNGVRVRTRRGELLEAVPGELFDLIVANPPYLPSPGPLPTRGAARHTEAGSDGRVLLDRLIARAPAHLTPGGALLVTHSSINDERRTLERMRAAGLEPTVLERRRGPLGPLLAARAPALERAGMIDPGVRDEDVLVVAGEAN